MRDGLQFAPGVSSQVDKLLISSGTEELDRYYDFLAGRVSTRPKPRLNIDDGFRQLISQIDASKSLGFSQLSALLLELGTDKQRMLLEKIASMREEFTSSGTPQIASMVVPELAQGFTTWIGDSLGLAEMETIDEICCQRRSEQHTEVWFLFALIGAEGRVKVKVYRSSFTSHVK